jgi:hypothetical protein
VQTYVGVTSCIVRHHRVQGNIDSSERGNVSGPSLAPLTSPTSISAPPSPYLSPNANSSASTLTLTPLQSLPVSLSSHSSFIRSACNGKRYVIFRIDQTMYGLKDAGKLSNLRLVSLLSESDFLETSTPCLFRHVSRPISFVLVVDDFGIKYQNRDDYDYLISCLSRLYLVKPHPIAS